METSRWKRIEDLPPADWAAFLDRVCNEDRDLRGEIESLLAADTPADGVLQSAVDRAVDHLRPTSDECFNLIGRRVGRYSITSLIGKGGMGAVYRAVREDDFACRSRSSCSIAPPTRKPV